MSPVTILGVFNYGLVLIYGLFLSVAISGGWENERQRRLVFLLCPFFLLIQSPCWLLLGAETVKKLYPLIVHLPLTLILIFALKKPLGVAAVSVFTGYLCCQLPRWVDILTAAVFHSDLAGEIAYTLSIGPLFYLLLRWLAESAYEAMTASRQSLLLFGSLPAAYYVFDYATTIYSNLLYAGIPVLNELIPTASILFYVLFLTAYYRENQRRSRVELENAAACALLKQSQTEMDALRQTQAQAAVFRHDLRHHFNVVDGLLSEGKSDQALEYIRKMRQEAASMAVVRYCGNETVNLILSSFRQKAEKDGISLTVEAALPEELPVSDVELCAILSNGLENALHAAARLPEGQRWVRCGCTVKREKLLLEIENPYLGQIAMEDVPTTDRPGHGFGCRSIRRITQQHGGLCSFTPKDGVFTLQVVLPLAVGEKGRA